VSSDRDRTRDELATDATVMAEPGPDTEPDPRPNEAMAYAGTLASGSVAEEPLTGDQATGYVDEAATAAAIARAGAPALPDRGDTLGRFVVLDRLGQGGFGVVLAAYDPDLDRKVAIKLIHPRLFQYISPEDAKQRLLREARSLAQLSHPNVVAVHEIGTFGEAVFIAMEFVPGRTLRDWIVKDRPGREDILEVFVAAGRGLAAAHRAGIIHRDFKPDNVMICTDGRVRVLDFGLARAAEEGTAARRAERPAGTGDDVDIVLTRAGAVMGTPAYMAPEQHEGRPADARTDQFSFCVSLYEALYGMRPFPGSTLPELSSSVIAGQLRAPPPDSGVPRSIERALVVGLATEPAARHATMDELLAELERSPRREAEDLLAGRWDPEARRAIEAAFARIGTAGAAAAVRRTEELLDGYAAAWVDAYAAAREPGADTGRAHERAAWLMARLDELGALVEVLSAADETIADHAVEACHQLAPLDRDKAGLAASEPALPADPELRQRVARLRVRLARARKLADAGKYGSALEVAREAQGEAAGQGYLPLEAEAAAAVGELAAQCGDPAAAESALWEAVLLADESGHDAVRARAACALVSIVGDVRARPDEGKRWARMARAVAVRRGGDDRLIGQVQLALARVLLRNGEYRAGCAQAREGAEALAAALGDEHPQVAEARATVGDALRELGAWDEAASELERALAIRTRALGPEHPHLARSLAALGELEAIRGRYDATLELHRRACAVAEAALAPDHGAHAGYLEHLGEAYSLLGRHREAIPPLERALALRESAFGPTHPDTAYALQHLGRAMRALGRYAEARRYYERALAVREQALGPDHPEVAACHNNLGMVLLSLDEHAAARDHHARALAIREARLGADHPVTANSLTNVGRACVPLGRHDEARAALERALAIWGPSGHHFQAYALTGLGALHRAEGHLDEAERTLEQALGIREPALGADHPSVAEILRPLAAVQAERGRPADARATLARALAVLEGAYGAEHPEARACAAELAALA
jgi:eukaryotic-like serine/threonine-protein kinase